MHAVTCVVIVVMCAVNFTATPGQGAEGQQLINFNTFHINGPTTLSPKTETVNNKEDIIPEPWTINLSF